MDAGFSPNKFNKGDIVGCIMLTQGFKTHWMETEEEMQIDDDMSIPTIWTIEKDKHELQPGHAYAFPPYIPHHGPDHPKNKYTMERIVFMVVFASKPLDGPPITIETTRG